MSNLRRYNIRVAKKLNSEKFCIYHPDRHRAQLSRYCSTCLQRARRVGCAKPGSRIHLRGRFVVDAEDAMEIIRLNKTHPLIAEGISVIDRLFFRAKRGVTLPGFNRKANQYIRRSAEADPNPVEVFAVLAGMNFRYFSKSTNPFSDHKNYTWNLARILIRWKRGANPNPLSVSAQNQIARYLDRKLGTILRLISQGMEQRELDKRERDKMLREPLVISDSEKVEDKPKSKKDKLKT